MKHIADPANRDALHQLLLKLQPNAISVWGKMTTQQMVKHMIEQVRYSDEELTFVCDVPKNRKCRQAEMIYTNAQIPPNLILGPFPAAYEYADLHTAIEQLMLELKILTAIFKQAHTVVNHGVFGLMDYSEWLIWHGKHLAHHLKQFVCCPFKM